MANPDYSSVPGAMPPEFARELAALRSLPGTGRAVQQQPGLGQPVPSAMLGAPSGQKLTWRQKVGIWIFGVDGARAFFPPLQPLQPVAQPPDMGARGRQWDYPTGLNIRTIPRGEESIGFPTLRGIADGYDVLRILIERVKDKIIACDWSISPKDDSVERDARCDEIEAFFQFPDKDHSWGDWLRMFLEQVIVYDAPTVWPEMTRGGDVYALHIIDGATIVPKITLEGRRPQPFEGPAFQQVLKGLPACDYIQAVPKGGDVPIDPLSGFPMPELFYRPRNPRVDHVYGFSPVEQVITTINIGLRREAYQLAYYTNGSVPDLLIGAPSTWNPDQIDSMQRLWDSVLEGNLQNRRGARFVPGDTKPFDTKEKALKDEFDEWMIRIFCFSLGLNPMPFVKQMNRGQEKQHHEEAAQEGLEPLQKFISDWVNWIIRIKWGITDLHHRWVEDDAIDPADQTVMDVALVNAKIYHPDEIRARRGDEAMTPEMRLQMDMPNFNGAANSTVLPEEQQPEAPPPVAPGALPGKPAPGEKPMPGKLLKKKAASVLKARRTIAQRY